MDLPPLSHFPPKWGFLTWDIFLSMVGTLGVGGGSRYNSGGCHEVVTARHIYFSSRKNLPQLSKRLHSYSIQSYLSAFRQNDTGNNGEALRYSTCTGIVQEIATTSSR